MTPKHSKMMEDRARHIVEKYVFNYTLPKDYETSNVEIEIVKAFLQIHDEAVAGERERIAMIADDRMKSAELLINKLIWADVRDEIRQLKGKL